MGKLLIASVGEQKEPIVRLFSKISGYDQIYLVVTNETLEVANQVSSELNKIFNKITVVLVDAFDINDIISKIILISKKKDVEFNITGGTKIMSLALYIASMMLNAKSYYYTLNDTLITLPRLNLELLKQMLSEKKFQILKKLYNRDYSLSELSNFLKIKVQTVEGHLSKLEKNDLIEKYRKNKSTYVKITDVGKLYLNLLSLTA